MGQVIHPIQSVAVVVDKSNTKYPVNRHKLFINNIEDFLFFKIYFSLNTFLVHKHCEPMYMYTLFHLYFTGY